MIHSSTVIIAVEPIDVSDESVIFYENDAIISSSLP